MLKTMQCWVVVNVNSHPIVVIASIVHPSDFARDSITSFICRLIFTQAELGLSSYIDNNFHDPWKPTQGTVSGCTADIWRRMTCRVMCFIIASAKRLGDTRDGNYFN
ncbi:uncharacterized protein ACNLHF_003942 [Anomaloglossus baeobatrachus]